MELGRGARIESKIDFRGKGANNINRFLENEWTYIIIVFIYCSHIFLAKSTGEGLR